jgi:hypothetical protein
VLHLLRPLVLVLLPLRRPVLVLLLLSKKAAK